MRLEDLIKQQKKNKKFRIVYPEVIPRAKKKVNERYLISKALLHLRKHFTIKELALIFRRSKKYIRNKIKDLRPPMD